MIQSKQIKRNEENWSSPTKPVDLSAFPIDRQKSMNSFHKKIKTNIKKN